MSIKIPQKERDGIIRRNGWLAGMAGSLLLISAGLELIAHRIFGQIDVDTLIWALALGFWVYVLGSTCFLILLGLWFVNWQRMRASRTATDPLSSSESNRRHFEEPELENLPHILEQGVASIVPGRSSWACDGGNKTNNRAGVARTVGLIVETNSR